MDREQLDALWQDTLPPGALHASDIFFTVRPKTLTSAPRAQTTRQGPADTELDEQLIEDSAPAAGEAIASSLHILEEIGRGGMGVVFRARQGSLEREVAIKKLRHDQTNNESRAAFLAEARLTGGLSHPNIVPVYDLGLDDQGRPLLVMKRVEGWSWRQLLDAKKKPAEGRDAVLKLTDHLGILIQICDALSFAHARGVAHLDLKPDNVMIGAFGEVLLMDWGIALAVGDKASASGIPHHSEVEGPRGTPAYFAPELAQGLGALIGPRSDVYLLGAVLFEILEGRPPHQRGDLMSAILHAVETPAPKVTNPRAPRELRRLCARALDGDPERRPKDPRAFQGALRAYLEHRESTLICERADANDRACRARLAADEPPSEAERNKLYADFAEAVAGYSQALLLWERNKRARRGQVGARRAFAEAALRFGDLGLAEAQAARLPRRDEEARSLRAKIADERKRQGRTRLAARLALAGVLVAVIALLGGLWLYARLRQAEQEQEIADQRLVIAAKQQALIVAENERAQAARERVQETLRAQFEAEDAVRRGREDSVVRAHLDRFLELSERSFASLLSAAEVALDNADFDYARARVSEAFKRFPLCLESTFLKKRIDDLQRPGGAHRLTMSPELDRAITEGRVPESELTLVVKARRRLKAGDNEGAIALLDRAERFSRGFATLYDYRAIAKSRLGRIDEALADHRRAAALDPYNPVVLVNLATAFSPLNQPAEAFQVLSRALVIAPNYTAARLFRAETAMFLKDYRSADYDASYLIRTGRPSKKAFTLRADARAFGGRLREAIADYERAIELGPGDAAVLERKATAHYDLGQFELALAALNDCLAADPKQINALGLRSRTLLRLGRLDEAIPDLKRLINARPRDPQAYFDLACVAASRKQFPAAEEGFTRVLTLAPDYSAAYIERAEVRRATNRIREARADLQALLRRNPNSRHAPRARALLAELDREREED